MVKAEASILCPSGAVEFRIGNISWLSLSPEEREKLKVERQEPEQVAKISVQKLAPQLVVSSEEKEPTKAPQEQPQVPFQSTATQPTESKLPVFLSLPLVCEQWVFAQQQLPSPKSPMVQSSFAIALSLEDLIKLSLGRSAAPRPRKKWDKSSGLQTIQLAEGEVEQPK